MSRPLKKGLFIAACLIKKIIEMDSKNYWAFKYKFIYI